MLAMRCLGFGLGLETWCRRLTSLSKDGSYKATA